MTGRPVRIAIVGVGKIARDQHFPALANNPDFQLVAAVSRHATALEVPIFERLDQLVAAMPDVDAVSLCTPPQGRHALALQAIEAGLDVMLEKPPGASVAEVAQLAARAEAKGATLFATWHSRMAPAVEPARGWLAGKQIRSIEVNWKEDVRRWHPGQTWIWQPGGLGVFDPGINALSVLTAVMSRPVFVTGAELSFPANCQAPIRASIELSDSLGTPIRAEFDFLQTGEQTWEMVFDTDDGPLHLSAGGARLAGGGRSLIDAPDQEYPALYRHFAELVRNRTSDVDLTPLQLVADAFMLGRRTEVEPFIE